ncbi:MAG: C25 family cysteine peptidase [Candidatus Alcyoniella australis]|nr:C25 family cysteine peptidase [Candidatus Alcyoniella australis]
MTKGMSRLLLSLCLVLLIAVPALAADSNLLNRTSTTVEPIYQDATTVELAVRFGGLEIEPTQLLGSNFTSIEIDSTGVLGVVGAPRVPVLRRFVRIPFGGEPLLEVLDASGATYSADQWGGSLPVQPQQPPVPKLPGALAARELTVDREIYASDRMLLDELAQIAEVGVWRGLRIALIEVYPVDLNPTTNSIDLLQSITLSISVPDADLRATELALERFSDERELEAARMLLINPPEAVKGSKQLERTMMVIAPPALSVDPSLDAYLVWKRLLGYDVLLLTTDVTGSDANSVRAAIQNVYTTYPVPLTSVLLVGDTDSIGYFNGSGSGSPATDLYFAAVDGSDYYPDLDVGRLPVRDASQLGNAVNKLMSHERGLWTIGDAWITHATFMAGNDNYDITEGTHNHVISTFLDPRVWVSDRVYDHTYNAGPSDITASINAGSSFVTYSGHGSETSWADGPPYNQSQVRALSNAVYPFVQSYACLTGKYEVNESFAETWVRAGAGAAVFMGSSVSSYWDEDDLMERAVFDGYFNESLSSTYGMMDFGKMALLTEYGPTSDVLRYFEMYNIMGDATLEVRSEVPLQLTMDVDNPLLLPLSSVEISVPETPAVRVTLYIAGLLHASALTDESGAVSFVIDPPIGGNTVMTIAATKHNTLPAVLDVPVVDSGVRVDSFTASGFDYAVGLDWQSSVETGVQSYALYRSDLEDGEYALIAEGIAPGGSPYYYEDQPLNGGLTYFYKLEVLTDVGSVWYGPVSATTTGQGQPPEDDDDDDSSCGG